MFCQGNKYPCLLGNRVKNNGPTRQSAAAKQIAEMQASKEDLCFQECKILADGITNPVRSTCDCTGVSRPIPMDNTLSKVDEPFETNGPPGEQFNRREINFNYKPHITPNHTARQF